MNLLISYFNVLYKALPIIVLFNLVNFLNIYFVELNLLSLFVYFLFSISFLLLKNQDRKKIFQIVYQYNILIVLLFYHYYNYKFGSPYEYGGTDDYRFENIILSIYQNTDSINSIITDFFSISNMAKADNYVLLSSIIVYPFKLLGFEYHTLYLRMVNSVFIGLASLLIYDILKNFNLSSKESMAGAIMYGMFPFIMFEGAHIYRDIINAYAFLFIVYYLMPLNGINKFNSSYIYKTPIFLLSLTIASTFRVGYDIIVIFILMLIFAFSRYKKNINLLAYYLVIFLGVISFSSFINPYVSTYYDAYIEYYKSTINADGLTSFIFDLPMRTGFLFRIFFIHLTPMPVFVFDSLNEVFQKIGTIIWIFFLPYLYKNIFSEDKRVQIILTIYLLLHYSVAFTTMQTRQFTTFLPFAVILIVLSLKNKFIPKYKFVSYFILFFIISSSYVFF